jgi:RNA polymerase sigma-70 factor, ECF subfamily
MTTCDPHGCAGLCVEGGLEAAYAEHLGTLVARARRVVVDPHLAEEAAHEALLRAWRSCARFDPERGPVRPWLLAITANVARDYVRARMRRPITAAFGAVGEATPDRTGERPLELVLRRRELVAALDVLSNEHRDAVVHTFLLDRPYDEVAARLRIRPGTLRSRVHYALAQLRAILEPVGEPVSRSAQGRSRLAG